MRLYLIRHPRPDIESGICYGSTDLCVSSQEMALVRSALVPMLPSGLPVFSSPLQRCIRLAEQLALALDAGAVIQDPRLVELDFGIWEGRAWDDIARKEIDAWAADPLRYRPGGGESVIQAATRIHVFLGALQQRPKHDAIVVCHAGTIRLLQASRNGTSPEQAAASAAQTAQAPAYGSLTVLDL